MVTGLAGRRASVQLETAFSRQRAIVGAPRASSALAPDTVPSGARVTYAVQAVDKAGNRSRPSASIAETAR